jgi:hypothetical protein
VSGIREKNQSPWSRAGSGTFLKMPGTVILAPDFWLLSPAFCINCADGRDKNFEGWER